MPRRASPRATLLGSVCRWASNLYSSGGNQSNQIEPAGMSVAQDPGQPHTFESSSLPRVASLALVAWLPRPAILTSTDCRWIFVR